MIPLWFGLSLVTITLTTYFLGYKIGRGRPRAHAPELRIKKLLRKTACINGTTRSQMDLFCGETGDSDYPYAIVQVTRVVYNPLPMHKIILQDLAQQGAMPVKDESFLP
jgi:hypothetical protein